MQFAYLQRFLELGYRADFVPRIEGVNIEGEREEVLDRLHPIHEERVLALGFQKQQWAQAQQVHGTGIAVVNGGGLEYGVDGLLSDTRGVCLGIYVADCAAVYLCDQEQKAMGLVHSGKKGTQGNIVGRAIRGMQEHFGSRPQDVIMGISPCIRPPDYEEDFALEIKEQGLQAGIVEEHIIDSGLSTAQRLDIFYSYRVEKGKTGRMLALLGFI